jgi:hypothetical protein
MPVARGSTAAWLVGVKERGGGGVWPARKPGQAIYSPELRRISTRGGPGGDAGREEGNIGHGGAYPRAAGDVAGCGSVGSMQEASRAAWVAAGSFRATREVAEAVLRGSAVSLGAESAAACSPEMRNRGGAWWRGEGRGERAPARVSGV